MDGSDVQMCRLVTQFVSVPGRREARGCKLQQQELCKRFTGVRHGRPSPSCGAPDFRSVLLTRLRKLSRKGADISREDQVSTANLPLFGGARTSLCRRIGGESAGLESIQDE